MRRADERRARKYWQRPSSTRADKRASSEHDHHAQNNRTASRTRAHEQRIPDHIVSLRRTAPLARPSFATTCRRQPAAISRNRDAKRPHHLLPAKHRRGRRGAGGSLGLGALQRPSRRDPAPLAGPHTPLRAAPEGDQHTVRPPASGGKHGAWWIGDYQGIAATGSTFHLVWNDTRTGKLDLYAAGVPV